jgi:RimJ/RimL family protein N-acetyltransferase
VTHDSDAKHQIFPYIETPRIQLRPASAAGDGPAFYRLLLQLGINTLPTEEDFVSAYCRDFAAYFAVQRKEPADEIGFSALFQLDPAGHVEVGVYTDPARNGPSLGAEAALLTINYAFAMWNIRKIYYRATGASLPYIGGMVIDLARKEGLLPGHQYFRGKLWDMHIFAIYREQWEAKGAELVERLASATGPGSHG